MFVLCADKNKLTVQEREPVTSGSVNVYPVRFTFSPDWDDLDKVAVFRAGGSSVSVPLPESGECQIPWDVLTEARAQLYAGVYGYQGGEIVLPTQWVYLGTILEGAARGETAKPPPGSSDGNEGTSDHRQLSHREDAEQHPIGAISGLDRELARIPAPVEPLTNEELEGLLT